MSQECPNCTYTKDGHLMKLCAEHTALVRPDGDGTGEWPKPETTTMRYPSREDGPRRYGVPAVIVSREQWDAMVAYINARQRHDGPAVLSARAALDAGLAGRKLEDRMVIKEPEARPRQCLQCLHCVPHITGCEDGRESLRCNLRFNRGVCDRRNPFSECQFYKKKEGK